MAGAATSPRPISEIYLHTGGGQIITVRHISDTHTMLQSGHTSLVDMLCEAGCQAAAAICGSENLPTNVDR